MTQWVYRQTEGASAGSSGLWTVGFYTPDGEWEPESDHGSAQSAADHVHWLNGGKSHAEWLAEGEPTARIESTLEAIRRRV